MLSAIQKSYNHTIFACYIGYITQAIINNFAPLLFLTFAASFGLSLDKITMIPTLNFAVQLTVDLISAKVIDRVGYRPSIITAHICSAAGMIALAVLPFVMDPFTGILIAVVLYAIGGGIIEVLISPIVEACPTERKEGAMSLLHSFYCWGHVALVLVSTAFFAIFGIDSWPVMACIWALVPLFNIFYFSLVPIYPIVPSGRHQQSLSQLFKQKVFWLLALMMVCSGAAELAMSQWASAFVEGALHISKTMGDLLGPCLFAVFMGTARAIYGKHSEKIPLKKMIIGSALLCIVCYVVAVTAQWPLMALAGCAVCGFSVGIFWPGTFSTAVRALPGGGTAMFALMSLAGDLGCSGGPTLVGLTSNIMNGNLKIGLATAIIFPLGILLCVSAIMKKKKS